MSATVATTTADRKAYYARLRPNNLAPLWEVLHDLVAPEPNAPLQPALWRYDDIRPVLMESGTLITAKEAERRVLILENPALPGESRITTSLYAGLQLVLPGEIAPAHRHSQSALRFVLEGSQGYTAVDGERTYMQRGDFIITPTWTWHDHGNDGDDPVVWLDGLDIPLVQSLDTSFAERYGEEAHPVTRPEGDALARYGAGMLPEGFESVRPVSPIFNYPYSRTRDALDTMRRTEEWDPNHGLKMRYINPVTGGSAMPTIGTAMQLLPKGFETAPYRSSDAVVFCVVEGTGTTRIGDESFDWGPSDVFVVPSWRHHVHVADTDAVLFSFSDRPVQQVLGLWREDRHRNA